MKRNSQKRLSKALAGAGVASRRASEEIIRAGRVTVNGEVALLPQILVDLSQDRITVDGGRIRGEEPKVYYLLNKPSGYICSAAGKGRRVLDLFAHIPYRLFTVGRLDQETTGLIILTNDGHFANRVIHPSYNVTKEYIAKTAQEITADHLKILSSGTYVDNAFVKPISVKKVRRGTVKIVVSEGKKHEVRLLLAKAGLNVKELCRIRIGPLMLHHLAPGQFRELTESERQLFL